MNQKEVKEFIDKELKPRWPEWELDATQTGDWFRALQDFSYTLAKQAVWQIAATKETSFRRPRLFVFLKLLRQLKRQQKPKELPQVNWPVLAYKCRCIEHKKRPQREGWEISFYITTQKALNGCTPEALLDYAQKHCSEIAELYGGRWITILPKHK